MRASIAIVSIGLCFVAGNAAAIGSAAPARAGDCVTLDIDGDGAGDTFTGTDGALVLTGGANCVIDLSRAIDGAWDTATVTPPVVCLPTGELAATGVYDAERWAVVFKFTDVDIGPGSVVTFVNHPSRAPVVWLVEGNVTIAGTINLNGSIYDIWSYSEPGPGGFRGGMNLSAGFGPGGGLLLSGGGSHASSGYQSGDIYGSPSVFPLVGGSGGAGRLGVCGGGAGGGAFLIAAQCRITVSGLISAVGGHSRSNCAGGGAGGAVRLVGQEIVTTAGLRIHAVGGSGGNYGGHGRIRLEAPSFDLGGLTDPEASWSRALGPVFPPAASPRVAIVQIDDASSGTHAVSLDPRADLDHPTDATLPIGGTVTVHVHAQNVPLDWIMKVRATHRRGFDAGIPEGAEYFPASYESGTFKSSMWTAQVDLANGVSALQARAFMPLP